MENDIESIKNYLKGNGFYEKSMSNNDMITLYKTIKHSEETAMEDVKKNSDRNLRKVSKNNNYMTIEYEHITENETKLYSDLRIIIQKPLYISAIYSLHHLSIEERRDKLDQIENRCRMEWERMQKESICFAKWGDPINMAPVTLKRNDSSSSIEAAAAPVTTDNDKAEEVDVYVSRCGRQTKRKLYTDNFYMSDSDEEEAKKPKTAKEKKTTTKKIENGMNCDVQVILQSLVVGNEDSGKKRIVPPLPSFSKRARNTGETSSKKSTTCPICNREFSQKDIAAHASSCGLTSELEIENNLSKGPE